MGALIGAIFIELSDQVFIVLKNRLRQVAFHEAKPIFIHHDFIFSIDCGDGIFTVHDGR